MRTQIKNNDVWVNGKPKLNEWFRKQVGTLSDGNAIWQEQRNIKAVPTNPAITLTVTLDKYQCSVGDTVNYTIDFSESITAPSIVPISVTDRQGKHITNIGCTITDGKATGSFSMPVAGDFTVTNESINFHKISIGTELEIANDFWLRVYQ